MIEFVLSDGIHTPYNNASLIFLIFCMVGKAIYCEFHRDTLDTVVLLARQVSTQLVHSLMTIIDSDVIIRQLFVTNVNHSGYHLCQLF